MPTRQRLKELMISELMLDMTADEIGDDTPLFGPAGIGLDSVDALQLVVALDKKYGVKVTDREVATRVLGSVSAMARAVAEKASGPAA
jgi:acyl carrier protein